MAIKTHNVDFLGNYSYPKTDFEEDRQHHLLDKKCVLHSLLPEKELARKTWSL